MATIYDVDASELILKVSDKLKSIETIKAPEWAPFVKTGVHKERTPVSEDWWYVRAASILRKVAILGPVGVNKLRKKYGGKKNRGHKPEHFYKGSGNIIRKILQQLEKSELIIQVEKGVHKGKVVTPKGKKLLDSTANEVFGVKPKKEVTEKAPVKEPKPKKEEKDSKQPSLKKNVDEEKTDGQI